LQTNGVIASLPYVVGLDFTDQQFQPLLMKSEFDASQWKKKTRS